LWINKSFKNDIDVAAAAIKICYLTTFKHYPNAHHLKLKK
jgi:hypothetical protein